MPSETASGVFAPQLQAGAPHVSALARILISPGARLSRCGSAGATRLGADPYAHCQWVLDRLSLGTPRRADEVRGARRFGISLGGVRASSWIPRWRSSCSHSRVDSRPPSVSAARLVTALPFARGLSRGLPTRDAFEADLANTTAVASYRNTRASDVGRFRHRSCERHGQARVRSRRERRDPRQHAEREYAPQAPHAVPAPWK